MCICEMIKQAKHFKCTQPQQLQFGQLCLVFCLNLYILRDCVSKKDKAMCFLNLLIYQLILSNIGTMNFNFHSSLEKIENYTHITDTFN